MRILLAGYSELQAVMAALSSSCIFSYLFKPIRRAKPASAGAAACRAGSGVCAKGSAP